MASPLVFGHRGASGYLPENTLEAFELAFAQGADAIECDLVPSRDGAVLIRHENSLSGTTDIATRADFADRFRAGVADGEPTKDWFSEDFDWSELASLKARERLPELRPASAAHDDEFPLVRLEQLLEADFARDRSLVLELKHAAYFERQGLDLSALVAKTVLASDWLSHGNRLVIETFDFAVLRRLKDLIGDAAEYVYLTELVRLPSNKPSLLPRFLDDVAAHFAGVSVDLDLLYFGHDEMPEEQITPLVRLAHERGLLAYCWTLRAEDALGYRDAASSWDSIRSYFESIIATGVDGIFADQPDLLKPVVAGLT